MVVKAADAPRTLSRAEAMPRRRREGGMSSVILLVVVVVVGEVRLFGLELEEGEGDDETVNVAGEEDEDEEEENKKDIGRAIRTTPAKATKLAICSFLVKGSLRSRWER